MVVSPGIRPQLKATLQRLLIDMDDDADGRQALRVLGVERFVPIDDAAYESVRQLVQAVGPLTP